MDAPMGLLPALSIGCPGTRSDKTGKRSSGPIFLVPVLNDQFFRCARLGAPVSDQIIQDGLSLLLACFLLERDGSLQEAPFESDPEA